MADTWRVKFDGTCTRCGATLLKGTAAVWDRPSRTMRCIECPGLPPTPPQPEPQTVDGGVAGRSARAEHDRREAKRDAAMTEAWGTGLVARVVRAISVEPQSTRAWAIGAAGEEKLAIELDTGLPQLNAPERMQKAGAEHETDRRMGPRSALT